jgi:hypothetical protein
MKKIFFLLAMLASIIASATVTVTPISTDYATKKITFKVAWSGTVIPHNNRVWVWVDFCPITGTVPATSFSTATVSNPTITGGNGSTATSTTRGFFIEYANASNAGTTVTATLSNAPDTPQKFNWCAYGSDMPPNATVIATGGYTLRGTLPFTINSSQTVTSKTFGAGTCITSITDLTGRSDGFATEKPSITAVTSPTICNGAAATLTAMVGGGTTTAMTYTWKVGAAAETTTTVPTYITTQLTGVSTYTVQARNLNGCTSAASTGTITFGNNFTAGAIAITGQTICSGTTPNVIGSTPAASGGDGNITYEWRRNGVSIGNNSPTYTPTAYNTTTGAHTFTRWAHDGICNPGWAQSSGQWVLTIVANPSAPSLSQNGPKCSGNYVTFSASGGSGNYQWGGDFSGSGSSKNSSTSAGNYTAQVRSYTTSSDTTCYSGYASVTGTVVSTPSTPSLSQNGPVCSGSYVRFTASGGSGYYEWSGNFSGSGSTSYKNSSTSAGNYTAQVRSYTTSSGTTCYSGYASVTGTVISTPSTPSLSQNGPKCAGTGVTFTASGGSNYDWSGAFSGSGSNKTTSTSAGSYTARVRAYNYSGSVYCYSGYTNNVTGQVLAPATNGQTANTCGCASGTSNCSGTCMTNCNSCAGCLLLVNSTHPYAFWRDKYCIISKYQCNNGGPIYQTEYSWTNNAWRKVIEGGEGCCHQGCNPYTKCN